MEDEPQCKLQYMITSMLISTRIQKAIAHLIQNPSCLIHYHECVYITVVFVLQAETIKVSRARELDQTIGLTRRTSNWRPTAVHQS